MAKLDDKVKHALDESLILVTGVEILIGFEYSAVFQQRFDSLPQPSQYLEVTSLGLMLFTLMLLVSPVPFHRIVEEGEDTARLNRYVRRIIEIALLPFAVGLGIDVYNVAGQIGGQLFGVIVGVVIGLTAIFFWYLLEILRRQRTARMKQDGKANTDTDEQANPTKLADRVDHLLTETRVVLPGAQALLGFQLVTILTDGFDKLDQPLKYLHLLSLALVALTTILLMTPAAYHRIVEQGEDTPEFCRVAGRFVIGAMIPLALALSLDFFIVASKISHSLLFALVSAGLLLLCFYGLWFGYTAYRRRQRATA